ncbi:MAG TPA: RsmB/NOP family class I SAM-dependent RNA methyltransferase [Opitutaceae bacterium]|nr:RsmB/NOP family class I SAM-dependent RNA methyltransferase [Opitutaceae bacterium]
MMSLQNAPSAVAWPVAVAMLERWLRRHDRLDALMEEAGRKAAGGLRGEERARCQHLLFGAVRHYDRLGAAVDARVPHPPRARLRAVLLVAGFELLETGTAPVAEGQAAKVVHHAVERAKALLSPAEARLVNAVLRKLAQAPELHAAPPGAAAGTAELARFFSHPEWLVRRWLGYFGAEATHRLLEWNQSPPPVYGRWRGPAEAPAWLPAAPWPGFLVVPAAHWPEIERWLTEGTLYLQNPATLMAAELLDPQRGETVLDLCAAPGGKSLLLADLLERGPRSDVEFRGERAPAYASSASPAPVAGATVPPIGPGLGRVVAVDLPDRRRIKRLQENLAKVRAVDVALIQADVLALSRALFAEHHVPATYAAVLLDAPCTNTGVMRHRVDVKWRLRETDIAKHAEQQLALLTAAARCVAPPGPESPHAGGGPGGRLVYSTCSLEAEENEGVVEAFLRASGGRFVLEQLRTSRPWETECDGGSAFRLRRIR